MPMFRVPPEFNLGNLPTVANGSVSGGVRGNVQTIEFMKKIARERSFYPVIRQFAKNILIYAGVDSNNYADEALAIGDYVKNKVRYLRDPDNIEYLQAPEDLIEQMAKGEAQGDCDDMALLIASLLLSIGHQPRFRAVRYKRNTGHYDHIYVVVYEKNRQGPRMRIALDAIMKQEPIGYEVSHQSGQEYPA